jgi:hypothetical protein
MSALPQRRCLEGSEQVTRRLGEPDHRSAHSVEVCDQRLAMVTSPHPVEAEREDGRSFLMSDRHPNALTLGPSLEQTHERDAPRIVEEHDDVGCGREGTHRRADAPLGDPTGGRNSLVDEGSKLVLRSTLRRRHPPENVDMMDRERHPEAQVLRQRGLASSRWSRDQDAHASSCNISRP